MAEGDEIVEIIVRAQYLVDVTGGHVCWAAVNSKQNEFA